MYDHVSVIHQYPVGEAETLRSERPDALFPQPLLDTLCNRPHLRDVLAGADDEIVRNHGEPPEIEDEWVDRFLVT